MHSLVKRGPSCSSVRRWRRQIAAYIATLQLIAIPSIGAAQIRKVDSEFLVNSYILYDQIEPRVDVLTPQSFITVWLGWDPVPGGLYGIRGRVFERSYAHGGDEFLLTPSVEFDHRIEQHPSVSARDGDGFVVAWESYDSGDLSDVGAQAWNIDGSENDSAVKVNQSEHAQQRPSVAIGPTGDFVVTWSDKPTLEDYSPRTRVRKFGPDGEPLTDEFGVTQNNGWSRDSSVVVQPDDSFVVVWQEDGSGILGQHFDGEAQPVAPPFLVSASAGTQPEIAASGSGSFVVVWQAYGEDGSLDIFGRRFEKDATALGEEFRINSYTLDQQVLPSLAAAPSGAFVVLWESYRDLFTLAGGQDGSGRGIFGQYFGADGQRVGREFRVNTYTVGDQGGSGYRGSDVAMWPDGGFVALWASADGLGLGTYGQIFAIDSTAGPLCGDTNADLVVTARDALQILRGSVGLPGCEECLCDVDSSASVTTTDAFAALTVATGLTRELACPPCDTTASLH